MKLRNLLITFSLILFTASFISCKKDNNNNGSASDELETTFELSGDQAIADNLTEDANDILMEAAVDNNFAGGKESSSATATRTMNILSICATVTVTDGFPKNITIDFGNGCTSANLITRKGKINIVLSDSLRKTGSVAVMTFDNYYVNGYKKEGKITWTNTSSADTKSWNRTCEDGKITAPNGNNWTHSGTRDIVQTEGVNTPWDLTDDVYSVTGNHTVTNSAGKTRNSTITNSLIKATSCENIGKGTIKIQGPNHYAIIDFGDGTCDKLATISIDGYPARTILLR